MTNLEKAKEEEEKAAAAAKSSSGLASEGIFSMMKIFLEKGEGKAMIPKV